MNSLSFFSKCFVGALAAISLLTYCATPAEADELPAVGDVLHIGPLHGGTICDTLEDATALLDLNDGDPFPPTCGKLMVVVMGTATVVAVIEKDFGTVIMCRYDMPGTPFPLQFGPWRTIPNELGQAI